MTEGWTEQDAAAAREQGWELVEVWDMGKKRLELAAMALDEAAAPDIAPMRVMWGTATGDETALKASKLIMASKLKSVWKGKKQ